MGDDPTAGHGSCSNPGPYVEWGRKWILKPGGRGRAEKCVMRAPWRTASLRHPVGKQWAPGAMTLLPALQASVDSPLLEKPQDRGRRGEWTEDT